MTARHYFFFRLIRHDSQLACVDSACRHLSHVILLCVDNTGDSMGFRHVASASLCFFLFLAGSELWS